MSLPYLKPVPDGIELSIVVQPRASKTRLVGEHGGALKIQLAAPPVDGEANAELLEFLSRLFGVARRQVELVSGEASRRKRVQVRGVDEAQARARLAGT